jgi:hypothetical protein
MTVRLIFRLSMPRVFTLKRPELEFYRNETAPVFPSAPQTLSTPAEEWPLDSPLRPREVARAGVPGEKEA